MYLSRLYVENYKSIKKLDITFKKGKNIIVGKNNAGKSNIIKAIDLIFGESSPTWSKSENITNNDFYKGNTANEIFIWCELTKDNGEQIDFSNVKGMFYKLKEKNTERIKTMKVDFSDKTELFKFFEEDAETEIDNKYKKEWIGTKGYCVRGFEDELNEMDIFAFAFRAKKIENRIIKNMLFLYKKQNDIDWLFSINANLRNKLLQSAIIPSFRSPKDQLRISNYSWYGKLLRHYIDENDPNLREAFEEVKKASENIFKKLQNKILDQNIKIAFPNTKINFYFNPETKQDIYKSTLIYVDDGFNSNLHEKGSGIQSAVIIGLFDYYIRNIAHKSGSSLLAIEEPELYLHPHGRRVISDRLDNFIDDGKNQVIITTHSPEFISTLHENINLIVVKKDKEKGTIAKNFDFSDIKTRQVLIKKQNAEMFFADAVILTEGADKYILEAIAEHIGKDIKIKSDSGEKILGKNWLNDYNVSIINCGGKHEFWKYAKIFKKLSLPYMIVADFDFFIEGLNKFFKKLNYNSELINQLNSIKSKIEISSKHKYLSQISDEAIKKEIKKYLITLLIQENIYVLTGELEYYYIYPPQHSKEAGVIEIISELIENKEKNIEDYIKIDEFEKALKVFMKNCLKLDLIETTT